MDTYKKVIRDTGIVLALLLLLMAALIWWMGSAEAQTPMESHESYSVYHIRTEIMRDDSADSTVFRVAGAGDMARSGILYAWKDMGLWVTATGDSVAVRVYIYAGSCETLTATTADTTTYRFAVVDSLDIEGEGRVNRQISNYMPSCDHWYLSMIGLTGNGAGTSLECTAIKERY